MTIEYQYWQNRKNEGVYAVKIRNGDPVRFCGPLGDRQYRGLDGRFLRLKLEVFHYGFHFEDDPYNYLICDS